MSIIIVVICWHFYQDGLSYDRAFSILVVFSPTLSWTLHHVLGLPSVVIYSASPLLKLPVQPYCLVAVMPCVLNLTILFVLFVLLRTCLLYRFSILFPLADFLMFHRNVLSTLRDMKLSWQLYAPKSSHAISCVKVELVFCVLFLPQLSGVDVMSDMASVVFINIHEDGGRDSLWNVGYKLTFSHSWSPKKTSFHLFCWHLFESPSKCMLYILKHKSSSINFNIPWNCLLGSQSPVSPQLCWTMSNLNFI
jgi:hypothetical protein